MLDPQLVVNLLPELGVRADLVRQSHRLGARFNSAAAQFLQLAFPVSSLSSKTNEFHERLSFGVDCSKSARNEESSSRGALNSSLTSVDSRLQVNLEIALSDASAKVKPTS